MTSTAHTSLLIIVLSSVSLAVSFAGSAPAFDETLPDVVDPVYSVCPPISIPCNQGPITGTVTDDNPGITVTARINGVLIAPPDYSPSATNSFSFPISCDDEGETVVITATDAAGNASVKYVQIESAQ